MQKQSLTNFKENVKNTIKDVEIWVNSLGHQLKFNEKEALDKFEKTKEEFKEAASHLKENVINAENFTTQKKDQVAGELIKLRGILDKEVGHKVEDIENYKTNLTTSIDNVEKNLAGEVDNRVKDDLNNFRIVANDIRLRLNTLRLFFIDHERKDRIVENLESKQVEVKSNLESFKQKLVSAKEETKDDISIIENGVKKDFQRLQDFVNKLTI